MKRLRGPAALLLVVGGLLAFPAVSLADDGHSPVPPELSGGPTDAVPQAPSAPPEPTQAEPQESHSPDPTTPPPDQPAPQPLPTPVDAQGEATQPQPGQAQDPPAPETSGIPLPAEGTARPGEDDPGRYSVEDIGATLTDIDNREDYQRRTDSDRHARSARWWHDMKLKWAAAYQRKVGQQAPARAGGGSHPAEGRGGGGAIDSGRRRREASGTATSNATHLL